MIKLLYWIYLNLIRKWSSPLLYYIINLFEGELPDQWNTIKHFNQKEFEKEINQYPYRWDYKKGIIDFSLQDPDFFFREGKYWRDCDDFARMWYWWAQENNYKVWEVCLCKGFKKAHFITIFKKGEKFILCNYNLSGEYDSLEKAIKSVKNYNDYLIYRKSGDE